MKYIRGYVLTWRGPFDARPPVYLSIEGGIEATRIWRSDERTIMIKLANHATNEIAHIEPIYVTGDYNIKKCLKENKCLPASEVEEKLLLAINEGDAPTLIGGDKPELLEGSNS